MIHSQAPLTVAQIIESDGPGGAETVVLQLSEELRRRGHVVRPIVLEGGEGWLSGRLKACGFEVATMPFNHSLPIDPRFVLQLSSWIRENRIDVIHSHEFTMSVYAGIARRLTGVRHVLTLHGSTYFASAVHRRLAMRAVVRHATATVGVSGSTCEAIREPLRLTSDEVTQIPNGIKFLVGDRAKARRAMGAEDSERIIVAVGNLYPVKGHDVLVRAAAHLAQMNTLPEWRVVIAGRGDQAAKLQEMIEGAGLSNRVTLLGLRSDIPDLLAAADCWVMPSRSEGLPMALLEAMHSSLPIVCSAVGGIPSVLEPAEAGLLVAPDDPMQLASAIARLLASPTLASAYGKRAAEVASLHYSIGAMTDSYLRIFQDEELR